MAKYTFTERRDHFSRGRTSVGWAMGTEPIPRAFLARGRIFSLHISFDSNNPHAFLCTGNDNLTADFLDGHVTITNPSGSIAIVRISPPTPRALYELTDILVNGEYAGNVGLDQIGVQAIARNEDKAITVTLDTDAYSPPAEPGPPQPPPPSEEVPPPVEETDTPERRTGFGIEIQLVPNLWTDISDELYDRLGSRIVRNTILHKDLLSVTNSCKIKLFGSRRIANIFDALPNDIPCRIFKNNQPWFSGYIRGDLGAQFKGGGICTIEVLDSSYKLNDQVDQYLGRESDGTYWTNIPLSNESDDSGLLTRIMLASGVERSRINFPDLTQIIKRFAVSADEDRKWIEVLSPLLFEHGYVLNVEPDGEYRLYDIYPPTVTPVRRLGPGDLEFTKSIKRQTKKVTFNSTRVIWYPQDIKENLVLFELTSGAREGFPCYVKVTPGRFFPTEASNDNAVYSVYQKVDGYEIVAAYNQKFEWSQPSSIPEGETGSLSPIVLVKQEHHPLFSDIRLQAANTGDFGLITKYTITGDAVVRDNLKEFREVTLGVENSSNIKEIKTKWVQSHEEAKRLSDGYTNWLINGQETIIFEGVGFEINEVYHIVDENLTYTRGLFRVMSVAENDIGRQSIIAERIPMGQRVGT